MISIPPELVDRLNRAQVALERTYLSRKGPCNCPGTDDCPPDCVECDCCRVTFAIHALSFLPKVQQWG